MPQHFTELDLSEIAKELRRRGYGFDSCRGFAFRLSRRSKNPGPVRYEPIGGPTPTQVGEIRRTSRDINHAADRIEAIALGKDQEVGDSMGGMDLNAVGKLIDNKIDSRFRSVEKTLETIMASLGVKLPPEPVAPPQLPIQAEEPPLEPEPVMRPPLLKTPAPPVEQKRPRGRPRKHPLPA